MGVPQKRERVFFICQRNDLNFPKLKLEFSEDGILFEKIDEGINVKRKKIRNGIKEYAEICPMGKSISFVHPKGHYFGTYKQHPKQISNTLIADSGGGIHLHNSGKGYLTNNEYCQIGTYPLDYNFKKIEPKYLIGMSVPPVMTAQVAHQIYLQWLSKTAE
jgi:DNA (cytosine-5)-methyltransferase 1